MSSIADRGRSDSTHPSQSSHEEDVGTPDRTLVGQSTSKKYDDAVGFVSEGRVVSTEMDTVEENRILLSHIHPSYEPQHTIKRILSRPVKIDTVTYSTNTLAGGQLAVYNIMDTFRNNAAFALGREKLSTFYGVNWRAHLKVTLNAQPFEAGLFQIYFKPFVKTIGAYIPGTVPDVNTLPFTTGCPNVCCNISLQSEVELSVPYSGPTPFINLTNDLMDFGNFYIQSIVPITDATNNASCELSVYLFFSEIELFGTSPNSQITTAAPQSLSSTQRLEEQQKTSGPISKIVTQVGNSLLPILDALGLSAPTTDLNPPRRHIDPYSSPSTADTVKSPLKVSYLSTQGVEIGQLGVDNHDECDINHIISKPTYYNQFSWDTSTEALTSLISYPVEPNNSSSFFYNNQQYVAPTRLRFMSNIFKYWRGTIKYTFHVVANKFHSGRLRFVYSLGGGIDNPLTNYPRSFTQVVDIRDATSFEIECEYFGVAPWKPVPQVLLADGSYVGDSNFPSPFNDTPATLSVYVENELRAATTTSQSLQVVCFVSAGSDFEFSVPIAASSIPVDNLAEAPADDDFVMAEPQSLSYQSLSMVGEDAEETQKNPQPMTTGEKIDNVRVLLRRYQLVGHGTTPQLTADNPTFANILTPYHLDLARARERLSYEMLSYFSRLFVFFRGGLRYLITSNDDDLQHTVRYNADITQTQPNAPGTSGYGYSGVYAISSYPEGTDFSSFPLTSTIPYLTKLQGGIEVEVPYYSRYHKAFSAGMVNLSVANYIHNVQQGFIPSGLLYIETTSKPSSFGNTALFKIYRTVADDFNFGYLLGAPIVTTRFT